MTVKREYGFALLVGAVGAGVIILAAREQWAQALFTQPKPLPAEVVDVSGNDLTPLAGALALAALAGLAAVIATRGVLRRAAGVLLALFGAGAGAAVMTSVTAATVLSVAASKVASPESAAVSQTGAGSTTSGASSGGGFVVSGSVGKAVMTGTPWHVVVLLGALLIFAAGLATFLRGQDWPVMSARYDAPGGQDARGAHQARAVDSATMWESLNGGEDPTDDPADESVAGQPAESTGGSSPER
jgi:uncharacterized membrane protein (TIGR02234 family)